jgi:hypothetical protein
MHGLTWLVTRHNVSEGFFNQGFLLFLGQTASKRKFGLELLNHDPLDIFFLHGKLLY